ncbi:hypothetical protein VULLAG_LOCUS18937 [Vulpes lagopus]
MNEKSLECEKMEDGIQEEKEKIVMAVPGARMEEGIRRLLSHGSTQGLVPDQQEGVRTGRILLSGSLQSSAGQLLDRSTHKGL